MGVSSIAASGMAASVVSYTVAANNIANAQTSGFKASRVNFSEANVARSGQQANGVQNQYGNGVKATIVSPSESPLPQDGEPQEPSNVDTTTELASLLQTGQSFKANAASSKGADFMLQTLLSM